MRVTHLMRLGTGAALTVARPRIGSLGTTEHCFYRAGESHCPSWGCSLGTSHLGYGSAVPTPPGPSGVVASRLTFCASPCIAPSGTRAPTTARWEVGPATLPPTSPTHPSHDH